MASNLGTAAYKLVLDARDFQSSAVQSGKSMREVQQVMRQTTTPAERMAKSYDAVTEAHKKGQIPLRNYQRYLDQLNGAASKNSMAVKDMISQYGRGIPVIGKYVAMIGQVPPVAIAAAAGIGAMVAAFKAGQFYFRQLNEQFAAIDAIAKRSKATGFDPTSLIGIERGAALVAGMDEATTEKSLAMFVRRLGEVKMGSGEAKRALDKLGLSADQLVKLSPTEALQQISDRFQRIETTAEQAATAQWLFGRAGAQLVPFLNEGGDAIARFVREAEDMRLGFSLEEAEKVERYNDAVADLGRAWEGLWRQAAIEAAPHLADAAERMQKAIADPEIQVALDHFATLTGDIAAGFIVIAENADKIKWIQDWHDTFGMGALINAPFRAMGIIGDVLGESEIAAVEDALESLGDRLEYFQTDAIDYFADTSPTPEWVQRWNDAEDALIGTADAFKDLLRDKQELIDSDKAFEKMLERENEKMEKANEEWDRFIEASVEKEKQRQSQSSRAPVSFEEGVRAGSAEAIRGARTQWLGAAEKSPENRLERQGDEQIQLLEQLATNTQTMVQSPQVVRVQGAF